MAIADGSVYATSVRCIGTVQVHRIPFTTRFIWNSLTLQSLLHGISGLDFATLESVTK